VVVVVGFLGLLFAGVVPAVAYPVGQAGSARINASVASPGSVLVVDVEHVTPGRLTMQILSAPVTIGRGTVAADGTGFVSGRVPAGFSGTHTITVTGAGGETFSFPLTVTVTPTGFFAGGCAVPADPGVYQVEFQGRDFPAAAGFTLLANGSEVATGTTSASGSLHLRGRLTVAPGTDVAVALRDASGTTVASTTFPSASCGTATTSPPPTTPPTSPPTSPATPTTSPTGSVTVTVPVTLSPSGGAGASAGTDGGALASTGARVAVGSGVGAGALVLGLGVLVAARRRVPRQH
jgi:hypothetical protein